MNNGQLIEIFNSYQMNLKNTLFYLGCIFFISVNAQIEKYNSYFTEGNHLFEEKHYLKALTAYLEAYKIDSTNQNINYKIGKCYLHHPSKKHLAEEKTHLKELKRIK